MGMGTEIQSPCSRDKSACMADRPEMFGPNRGFAGWPIQLNHAKCCEADPYCHGNKIRARRGDPDAYRLV